MELEGAACPCGAMDVLTDSVKRLLTGFRKKINTATEGL